MTSPHVQEVIASGAKTGQDRFVFAVCQQGAERPLKERFTGPGAPLRLAFSRPGLATFKTNVDQTSPLSHSWLARVAGEGLGNVRGKLAEEMVSQTLALAAGDFQAVHIFERDHALPGTRGFEPGRSELTEAVGKIFADSYRNAGNRVPLINSACSIGSKVLDVILVEPDQWLIGTHTATEIQHCWPGGVYPVVAPDEMVSRAYLKIAEAVAWSQLPMQPGDRVVEIGSAPGGSCQRLLDVGLEVTGVDPAEMDELLLNHPRFEHWRSKAAGMKRKMYSKFKWLTADANVAPNYTLEVVEDIVNYPTSRFQGLLLTLKLSSYELIDQVDAAAEQIRSWGFSKVKIRQLASNRRECCIAAQR
ncbi:MAG: SAM-dependent methyltransferase [Pirellulaceae bacterium]|nr:SAM-dependent methyltransferase [Pirellulaceae bacterium]